MKEWQYHPSLALNKSIAESLIVFPRERDMTCTILRVLWNGFLRVFLKIYFRLKVKGKENLPSDQSFVIVANHSSHLDALCLCAALPMNSINRTFSVAAKDYFFSTFFRSVGAVILTNALPFDREQKCRESLELCADVLNVSDQALIMFPEGTRSLTGEMQTFKCGIGILTAGTDRLVLPAYIRGAYQLWPKGSKFPKPGRVEIVIGEPMHFQQIQRNKNGYERVAQSCEEAVRSLGKN